MLRYVYKLPFYLLGAIVVLFIRVIQPILLIRIGMLGASRIGHFVGNTEMYLSEKKAGINIPNQRYVDLFFIPKPISNTFIAKIWKRSLRVLPSLILAPIFRLNQLFPDSSKFTAGETTQSDRDVFNLLNRFESNIKFNQDEIKLGRDLLLQMGIPEKASFVCLMVRDNAYLRHHFPNSDFSYHDFRSSSIEQYKEMAEYLASQGFYVVRMGERVETAFPSKNPKVIDYANSNHRSNFMDVFLGATCAFAVSTGTGWDAIPEMTRRPIVFVNFVPLAYIHTSRREIVTLPKKLRWKANGNMLNVSEFFSTNIAYALRLQDYEEAGIILEENSSDEITEAVKEMISLLAGIEFENVKAKEVQEKFWKMFPLDCVDPYKQQRLHGDNFSRISSYFLLKHDKFLN